MVTLADRVPLAVGVNVTLIVQLAPAATLDPQVLVCAKSPGFAPVSEMLWIVSVFPRLVSVIVCGLLVVPTSRLEKVIELLDSDTALWPLPLRFTVSLPELVLSVIVKVALIDPIVDGVKVTVKVHTAPAATLLPQLLVSLKAALFAPEIVTLEMFNVTVPVLVSVTVCGALLVPTTCAP
jgi:hypothetical protein